MFVVSWTVLGPHRSGLCNPKADPALLQLLFEGLAKKVDEKSPDYGFTAARRRT